MDRAEAIWYLQPIADSASLERYKEALNIALAALREQELLAEKQATSEWVSVKERLPDKPMKCLVYAKRGEYGGYDITYYHQGFYIPYSNVTHWMPLPEPPKEGAEG